MSEKQTTQNQKQANASTSESRTATAKDDAGQAEIQAAWDEANAKGYWGEVPDETPNEDYTVAGVTKEAKGNK